MEIISIYPKSHSPQAIEVSLFLSCLKTFPWSIAIRATTFTHINSIRIFLMLWTRAFLELCTDNLHRRLWKFHAGNFSHRRSITHHHWSISLYEASEDSAYMRQLPMLKGLKFILDNCMFACENKWSSRCGVKIRTCIHCYFDRRMIIS